MHKTCNYCQKVGFSTIVYLWTLQWRCRFTSSAADFPLYSWSKILLFVLETWAPLISLVESETAEVHRHDSCDMNFPANYLTLHAARYKKDKPPSNFSLAHIDSRWIIISLGVTSVRNRDKETLVLFSSLLVNFLALCTLFFTPFWENPPDWQEKFDVHTWFFCVKGCFSSRVAALSNCFLSAKNLDQFQWDWESLLIFSSYKEMRISVNLCYLLDWFTAYNLIEAYRLAIILRVSTFLI